MTTRTKRMNFEPLETRAFPAAIMETVDVIELNGSGADGMSRVLQNDNGVSINFQAEDLQAGTYTLWAVIFNDPSQCTDTCGADDFQNGLGNLTRVDGKVVGPSGRTTFAGRLNANSNGPLTNPEAEIHLIVRYHGEAIAGLVDEQIHTLNGGCPPNVCEDVAAAIHQRT